MNLLISQWTKCLVSTLDIIASKENYIDLFKTDLYWRWHSGIHCKCNKKVINWRKIAVNQNARNWHWQCVDYGRNKFRRLRAKKDIPHLILIRCMCHSLQLAESIPFAIDHRHSQQPVPRGFPLFKRCEWVVIKCNVGKRAPLNLLLNRITIEKTLSRNIEFLIKETYTWFANSFIRQLNYAQIYQILNDDQDPLKILLRRCDGYQSSLQSNEFWING